MKIGSFICVFVLATSSLFAQGEWSFGFKAGLNFSDMDGALEIDDQGNELEEPGYSIGFGVGALFNYSITDNFGLRTELLYAQKGRVIRYNGPSYFIFNATNDDRIVTIGDRDLSLEVINSYLEIPILGYARLGKFEVMGGAYVSGLINATGSGRVTFTPVARQGTNFDELELALDYRYRRDEAGEGAGAIRPLVVNGQSIDVPENLGAYYEYEKADKSLYRFLDAGVIGGLSFYFNDGFFINSRIEYGLIDATNNDRDFSLYSLDNGQLQSRNDNDQNFTIHTSVAFRF